MSNAALAFLLGSSEEYRTNLCEASSLSCGGIVNNAWARVWMARGGNAARTLSHLEEFMHQNARFVYHCDIQRAPILEEREIKELVVDCEVIIGSVIIGCCWGAASCSGAYVWLVSLIYGNFVQCLRIGWWMGKGCKVKSDRQSLRW